jgi:hypothetical protein
VPTAPTNLLVMTPRSGTSLLVVVLFALAACTPAPTADAPAERGAFVTLLGTDTLAVEQFSRTSSGMEATAVLRTPRTTVQHFRLDLDDAGNLRRYEAVIEEPGAGVPLRREVVTPVGDSLQVVATTEGQTQTRRIAGDARALPFIDMVHWPFELMLSRARDAGQASLEQPLFTARGTTPFVIRSDGGEAMTVTHPFRGTMDVRADAQGRLQFLSAGATTRALTVTRAPAVDVEAFARRAAALDAAGQAFGPLSGRAETVAQVDGATIRVDYGQPARRGREIFGQLVSWGQIWRTGANLATHFETDRTLVFGDVTVPAGQYTLFSIPEPDGGTLIINRQTGQTGTAHDPGRDLGRIPMTRTALPETVELFTIEVADTAAGGELRLVWDRTAFVVPFRVAD